jgi:hypothetical protein
VLVALEHEKVGLVPMVSTLVYCQWWYTALALLLAAPLPAVTPS